MTDQPQTIPADQVRKIIARYRDGANDQGGRILADLKDLLPPPTLADMTMEERLACRRMQADVEGRDRRPVIVNPYWDDGTARAMWPNGFIEEIDWKRITPRPDLARLEWPGDKQPAPEPAPEPALPAGWRLAKHPQYGPVVVTSTELDDGYVWFVRPDPYGGSEGYDAGCCKPAALTYIDQEADQ